MSDALIMCVPTAEGSRSPQTGFIDPAEYERSSQRVLANMCLGAPSDPGPVDHD